MRAADHDRAQVLARIRRQDALRLRLCAFEVGQPVLDKMSKARTIGSVDLCSARFEQCGKARLFERQRRCHHRQLVIPRRRRLDRRLGTDKFYVGKLGAQFVNADCGRRVAREHDRLCPQVFEPRTIGAHNLLQPQFGQASVRRMSIVGKI